MTQYAFLIVFGIIVFAMIVQTLNRKTPDNPIRHEAMPYDEGSEIPLDKLYESDLGNSNESNEINRIDEAAMENPRYNTQQLMVSTLTQIGCQPTVNEDDTVAVTYQGEHFHIDFGGLYAHIWDLGWAGVSVNDPELPKIREAVNHTNFDFGPTVVMTNPDDKGTMYFHSRLGILLHPDIPEIDSYLRSNLDMFFRTKEAVRQNFQQITVDRQKAREKRRPVGFTSSTVSKEVNN